MNRTLEVLEGNVDLLINRFSTLISERDGFRSEVSGLEGRVRDLETRLASVQEQATMLEGRLAKAEGQKRSASRAVEQLIERLTGDSGAVVAAQEPVQTERTIATPTPVGVSDSAPAPLPPPADPPAMDAPQAGREDDFEAAVERLKPLSLDREHIPVATAGRARIF